MAIEKQVVRYGPLEDFIAQGVRVGDTIHLSGQVSVDAAGVTVAPGDIVGQVRQAYANVAEVLAISAPFTRNGTMAKLLVSPPRIDGGFQAQPRFHGFGGVQAQVVAHPPAGQEHAHRQA
jgi:hypothetical protein